MLPNARTGEKTFTWRGKNSSPFLFEIWKILVIFFSLSDEMEIPVVNQKKMEKRGLKGKKETEKSTLLRDSFQKNRNPHQLYQLQRR